MEMEIETPWNREAGETATCLYLHPLAVEMGARTFVNSLNAYHERARGREYSAQATVASKLKKQSPPESMMSPFVEGPITPAMDRTLIFDAHASVRIASIPNTRWQSALRFFAIRLRRLSDAGCACLRWRPWKTAVLLVILADPLEGRGWDVLRDGR